MAICMMVVGLQVLNDENEQECVETPMDEIEYEDPVTNEWVKLAFEVIRQIGE